MQNTVLSKNNEQKLQIDNIYRSTFVMITCGFFTLGNHLKRNQNGKKLKMLQKYTLNWTVAIKSVYCIIGIIISMREVKPKQGRNR